MNKTTFFILFSFVFFLFFVFAQEKDIREDSSFYGLTDTSNKFEEGMKFKNEKVSALLSNSSVLPEKFQKFVRLFFNVKDREEISLSSFIILISLFGIFCLLIFNLSLYDLFFDKEQKILSFLLNFSVILLVSLSGAFWKMHGFFLNFFLFREFFDKHPLLKIVFTLFLLVFLYFGFRVLYYLIKKDLSVKSKEVLGFKVGSKL